MSNITHLKSKTLSMYQKAANLNHMTIQDKLQIENISNMILQFLPIIYVRCLKARHLWADTFSLIFVIST